MWREPDPGVMTDDRYPPLFIVARGMEFAKSLLRQEECRTSCRNDLE
jgi:hypothetical protein